MVATAEQGELLAFPLSVPFPPAVLGLLGEAALGSGAATSVTGEEGGGMGGRAGNDHLTTHNLQTSIFGTFLIVKDDKNELQ